MVNNGLICPEQFCGIDNNEEIIEKNKKWHPKANWFCGQWQNVIRQQASKGRFRPGLVYLDSVNFGNNDIVWYLTDTTMDLCLQNTVLFVNVVSRMLLTGKKHVDINERIERLMKRISVFDIEKYRSLKECQPYTYCSGKTEMTTIVLHKVKA